MCLGGRFEGLLEGVYVEVRPVGGLEYDSLPAYHAFNCRGEFPRELDRYDDGAVLIGRCMVGTNGRSNIELPKKQAAAPQPPAAVATGNGRRPG